MTLTRITSTIGAVALAGLLVSSTYVAPAAGSAAVLLGPSAQARAPHTTAQPLRPAFGHTTNEWLMMGRNCGASATSG